MARFSLSPKFIRDSLSVFKQRGIKGLIFGKKVTLNESEARMLNDVSSAFPKLASKGAKKGKLSKIDAIHKGQGTVYLVPHPTDKKKSLIIFADNTKIANGPDLWLYLSKTNDPKQNIGEFINLGLLSGNKGGQVYEINEPINQLSDYKTAIIYCKQFEVLFSYANLL